MRQNLFLRILLVGRRKRLIFAMRRPKESEHLRAVLWSSLTDRLMLDCTSLIPFSRRSQRPSRTVMASKRRSEITESILAPPMKPALEIRHPALGIERRISYPLEANRFYSIAGFRTDVHLELLHELENAIPK